MFTFLGILPAWSQPLQETLIHLQAKSPEGVRADKYDSYFIVHTGRDITTERLSFSYHLSDQGFASETALEEYMMMNDRFLAQLSSPRAAGSLFRRNSPTRSVWNGILTGKQTSYFPDEKGAGQASARCQVT